MFKPNSLILYVNDVALSTKFYADILKQQPLETYQDFSVFALNDTFILGLQSKHAIDPKPQPHTGGVELCLSDVVEEQVDAIYQEWLAKDIKFALEPTRLEFGYTFVALDPDGHRLRVCATDTTNIEKI